ncbi:MAG: serine hydrolase domain-containing protein [Candidatus Bathyanammoxibius sp.]
MNGGIIGDPEKVGVDRDGLEKAMGLLEEQRERGLHDGAQLFVARKGQPLLDVAIGEAQPGVPLRTNSVMLWLSSTKPLTAVAIAQLMERGKLKPDDRVQSFIPAFANGKEAATIRHVLTHTSGFPMPSFSFTRVSQDEAIQQICEAPAEWEPGTAAGYHGLSGWSILGQIVRRVDGRPIEVYLDEEIMKPLGMNDSSLGVTEARAADLGNRLSRVTIKSDEEYLADMMSWNDPETLRVTLPGASGYGPAHDLGRFYLALWNGGEWGGARVLKKETVELFTTTHRRDMVDRSNSAMFGMEVRPPWGLGFMKGSDTEEPVGLRYGRLCTSTAYGHGGAFSSIGFVEPSRDLVVVIVTNGFTENMANTYRLRDVSDAIHSACR